MSSVEFPLSPVQRSEGIVAEPIVPVGIRTPAGFKLYDFLVDSGADLTLLPQSLAIELGVNLRRCASSQTFGVEGKGVTISHTSVTIRIGRWEQQIRCAFAHHDHIPPLLGRLDVFSKYNITFHGGRNCIIFQQCQNR